MDELNPQQQQRSTLSADLVVLREQIEVLLREAATWTRPDLLLRPGTSTWCALEVLDHLRRCGESVAEQAERHLPAATTRRARPTLRRTLLFAIMRSPLRVSVPKSSPELHPRVPTSLEEVAEQALQLHLRLQFLFENLSTEQMDAAVFYHPVGGWMNPATALQFLTLHARHHTHQLRRLRRVASYGRPRPGQNSALLPA